MNLIKKLILAQFIMYLLSSNNVYSKEFNYAQLKKDSYKVFIDAMYDPNTYDKFKYEIIDTLGNLSDITDKSYSNHSTECPLSFNAIKSTLSKMKTKTNKNNSDLFPVDLNKKAKEINSKGDAAIAYILKDALNDPDYTIQILASTALMKINDQSTYPVIEELLDSSKNQDKFVALAVLSNLKNKNAQDKIIKIINDPNSNDKLKICAMNILREIAPEKALELAKVLTNSSNPDLKIEAIVDMILLNSPDGFNAYKNSLKDPALTDKAMLHIIKIVDILQENSIDLLKYMSNDDNDNVRSYTTLAMFKLKDKGKILDILEKTVFDNNPQVKINSYKVLAGIKDPQILPILSKVEFDRPELDKMAQGILIDSNNEILDPLLEKYLLNNSNEQKIKIAEYFLKNNRNKKLSQDILYKSLDSKENTVILNAVYVLIENDLPLDKKIMDFVLNAKESNQKAKVFVLLASKKNKSIIPVLEGFIANDKDFNKTFGAALLLYNLGEKDHMNTLIKYLSQSNIRSINEQYINKDLFISLLNNNNDWVKLNCAESLLLIKETAALKTLKELTNNPDNKLRSKAVKLMGDFGEPEDIELLTTKLNDEYIRVRLYSSEAILRILNRIRTQIRS